MLFDPHAHLIIHVPRLALDSLSYPGKNHGQAVWLHENDRINIQHNVEWKSEGPEVDRLEGGINWRLGLLHV